MNRTPWTRDIDPDTIPTPPHARSSPAAPPKPHRFRPRGAAPASEATSAAAAPEAGSGPVLWALALALVFFLGCVVLCYRHEHFAAIAGVGSVGVFVLSYLILRDRQRG